MRAYVASLDYGNREIGEAVDLFWLQGPLKISAIEQTRFLARLAENSLPMPAANQAMTRDIIKQESGNGVDLYAKTGTASSLAPAVGWWVGWVERDGKIYSFALNIDLILPEDAAKRTSVGTACLKELGLL
jgi:beta-lactamase class D